MAQSITFNGVTYSVPAIGDRSWGASLSAYFVAISTGSLQKTGGSFTLTADVDFGATKGLKSVYYITKNSTPATAGQLRLGRTDVISWRDQANGANLDLGVDASNNLNFNNHIVIPSSGIIPPGAGGTGISNNSGQTITFAGTNNGITFTVAGATALTLPTSGTVATLAGSETLTNKTMSGASNTFTNISLTTGVTGTLPVANGGTGLASYTSGDMLYASGATTLAKLALGAANAVLKTDGSVLVWGALVNANIDAAAAIAYSKLNLATSIVNADINGSAAIAYSKLNLTGAVVNADLAGSIAASKLVGTDIATVGTVTAGTWTASVIGPAYGGTGVANNAAATLTRSGNHALTLTTTNTTGVTLPTTGTLATLAGSETLTNKTLTSPTVNTGTFGTSATMTGFVAVNKNDEASAAAIPSLPITKSLVRLSGGTATDLQGMSGAGADGQVLWLMNPTGQNLTIRNNSASGTSKILTPSGADVVSTGDCAACFIYDSSSGFWRLMSFLD